MTKPNERKKTGERNGCGRHINFFLPLIFSHFLFFHASRVWSTIECCFLFFSHRRIFFATFCPPSYSIVLLEHTLIYRHNLSLWTTCKLRKDLCVFYTEWILWFTHTHGVAYVHTVCDYVRFFRFSFFLFFVFFFFLVVDSMLLLIAVICIRDREMLRIIARLISCCFVMSRRTIHVCLCVYKNYL